MRVGVFIASLAIALSVSSGSFGQVVCSGKGDKTARVKMQFVIPQNQVRVRFMRELIRYAAKNSFDLSEWGPIPPGLGWYELEGRSYLSLLKRLKFPASVQIALITTDRKDTFEAELLTCNFDDWEPYWMDFESFSKARHYELTPK